jgi:hypothetical protein
VTKKIRSRLFALLCAAGLACASLTPRGAEVRVFESDVATPETPAPALPEGCKILTRWGPIDQQEQARHIYDPYRAERNEAATKGGNVLLVKSSRIMTLRKTECPPGDNSQACADTAQNWYKVSFESYACDAAGLQVLAELKPKPGVTGPLVWAGKRNPEPAAASAAPNAKPAAFAPAPAATPSASASLLKSKILALMQEGVGTDLILSYVRANRLATALTAEEIIDWKKAGIAEAVILASFPP